MHETEELLTLAGLAGLAGLAVAVLAEKTARKLKVLPFHKCFVKLNKVFKAF